MTLKQVALFSAVPVIALLSACKSPCNEGNVETADKWCVIPLTCPEGSQPSLHHERCELPDGGVFVPGTRVDDNAGTPGTQGTTTSGQGRAAGSGGGRSPIAGFSGTSSGGSTAGVGGHAGGKQASSDDADAGMSSMPTSTTATDAGSPVARCGNGMVEQGEKCDGNCRTSCAPAKGCAREKMTGSAATCDVDCVPAEIAECLSGDECCAKGCKYPEDSDCSKSCGDGVVDPPELCELTSKDKPCPTSEAMCDDGNDCTADRLTGTAAQCNAACTHMPITAPASGDHCCPDGANASNDSDCPTKCGDGVVTGAETCDTASRTKPCPTSCSSGSGCMREVLAGDADQCTAACMPMTITTRAGGDGCCPAGADASNDSDCPTKCGDGVVTGNETCDTASRDKPCPTSCSGGSGCMREMLVGTAAQCNAVCAPTTITRPANGDGCCPQGASAATDSDCPVPTGCTQPSAENSLKNPGFSSTLDGWVVESGPGSISWVNGDSESCSISGAAQFSVSNAVSRRVEQCVTVAGGAQYYFAALIKGSGQGETTTCQVDTYNLSGCIGNSSTQAQIQWLNVQWGPTTTTALMTDTAVVSARISCTVDATGISGAGSEIDSVYLGRADKRF